MLKILSLLSLLFSPYALAANNDLDTLLEKFNTLTSAWEPIIIEAVTGLFWLLVILSFTWGAIQLWIRQAGLDEIIAELFERIFTIGFCWFLLNNAASLAWYLMNSVQEVVTRLSGGKESLTPSNIIEVGLVLAQRIWESSSGFDVGEFIIIGLCGLIVLIVLALIAAQMTVLIVGAYILLNGGVIIMGFLGSDWTRNHAINYFSTVLGISLQIFIMQLLVIVGNDLIMGFIDTASEGAADYMGMVVMSILYYALICVVPNMASSLTNGFFTFDSAKAVHSGAGVAAAAAGLSLLAKSGMEVGASKLSQTSIGQKVQDTLSQFTSGSGAIQSASSGAGALLQGADKLTNSALNSMAQQSSIGRAFSQMAKESIPSDGHKTLSKAMGGGASETLSSDDAVKQATSSFQGTSNHDALKSRLQEHRQQPRTNKRV